MSDERTWRVIAPDGTVQTVSGEYLRQAMVEGEDSPRMAVTIAAVTHRWDVAEIVGPGESTKAELLGTLQNILARIHRDGGHYVSEHGLEKAADDADARVCEMLGVVDARNTLQSITNAMGLPADSTPEVIVEMLHKVCGSADELYEAWGVAKLECAAKELEALRSVADQSLLTVIRTTRCSCCGDCAEDHVAIDGKFRECKLCECTQYED